MVYMCCSHRKQGYSLVFTVLNVYDMKAQILILNIYVMTVGNLNRGTFEKLVLTPHSHNHLLSYGWPHK